MQGNLIVNESKKLVELLRWNKPSGRLILLIPAGWSLWLTPSAPPSTKLFTLIIAGGVLVSGAGCVANDLWDRKIDKHVNRTKNRPLAIDSSKIASAFFLLFITLSLSLLVVFFLPQTSRLITLKLAILSLPAILLYPSTKRWFALPQAVLAFCWGFAVLIPWAASEASLQGGWPLIGCWLSTLTWTFGFDTVYALADKNDDKRLGINSSAIFLGENVLKVISLSYLFTNIFIGLSAFFAGVNWIFWPFLFLTAYGMQRETLVLKKYFDTPSIYGKHFKNQVWLGGLLLMGLILSRIN